MKKLLVIICGCLVTFACTGQSVILDQKTLDQKLSKDTMVSNPHMIAKIKLEAKRDSLRMAAKKQPAKKTQKAKSQ